MSNPRSLRKNNFVYRLGLGSRLEGRGGVGLGAAPKSEAELMAQPLQILRTDHRCTDPASRI
jgi:hypothetical protein